MKNACFRIGVYLLAVATLMIAARFVLPLFVGQNDNMTWEILIIFGMIIYVISAILLFIGRKDK